MKAFLPLAATLFLSTPLLTAQRPAHAQPSKSYGMKSGLAWPKLRRGIHGYQTKALQNLLAARGYKVKADGIFGTTTQSALRSFQKARGLKVDGLAGSQTWEALVPTLGRGSRGRAVTTLQTLLNGNDHALRNDGVYGATTAQAVRDFQEGNDLNSTGKADADTWCVLVGGTIPQGD